MVRSNIDGGQVIGSDDSGGRTAGEPTCAQTATTANRGAFGDAKFRRLGSLADLTLGLLRHISLGVCHEPGPFPSLIPRAWRRVGHGIARPYSMVADRAD